MANLFNSLRSSSTALDALQRSVKTVQNNVSNASTPGYAKQRMNLSAQEFSFDGSLAGGVQVSGLTTYRDRYSEANVRAQATVLGFTEQSARQLAWVESSFSLDDKGGLAPAMDDLFKAFTSWSVAPSSLSEKENVYAMSDKLATTFNRIANSLQQSANESGRQIETTLRTIDTITERIRLFNTSTRTGGKDDAGLDARLNADLEDLAQLVNFDAVFQEDGTVTVVAAAGAALVVGDQRLTMAASFEQNDPAPLHPDALLPVVIRSSSGVDITGSVTGGKLGALIAFRNEKLAEYLGTTQTQGQLNRLAETVATRINDILATGQQPPDPPVPMFILGSSPVAIAQAMRVNPALEPGMLQATDVSTNPPKANGVAFRLAGLANPSDQDDMLDGVSFIGAVGRLAAKSGRDYAEAKQQNDSRIQLLTQARNLRDSISAVSLDEEAIRLVEFQRAYQAAARLVTALDEIMEMTVNLGRV